MHRAKPWLMVVALLVLTAGLGLYLQHQAIESLKDTVAEQKLESVQTVSTIAALEADNARLQHALVERVAPPPVLVQTLGETTERSVPATRPRPAAGGSVTTALADPRPYDAFVRSANLTEKQTEEFYRLMGKLTPERRDLEASVHQAASSGTMAGMDAVREQLTGATAEELKGLLGTDGFAHFESYEKTAYYRAAFVDPISSALASGDTPLSDEQVSQLVALVASNDHSRYAQTSDLGSQPDIDWTTVMKAAKSSLSPRQQTELEGYVTDQESSGK